MKRNFLVVLVAALLLAPWPIVYAYEGVNADSETSPTIQAAAAEYGPVIKAYGNAVGKVTSGELFYIDLTGTQVDSRYQLMITNSDELVHDYRFMNLKVGIYVQGEDENHWTKMAATNGDKLPDMFITMFTGTVDFNLRGGTRYKIIIETGCFYCYGLTQEAEAAAPSFYLTGM
jgi:hypothetical protein